MILLLSVYTYMTKLRCPRCGGLSWIEIHDRTPVQTCVCGLHKWLEIKGDGMLITRKPLVTAEIKLPAKGTQLSKILGAMVVYGEISSESLATCLGVPINKVTTNLSVLRSRGLITASECRRGKVGGSIWEVNESVIKRMKGSI